MNINFFQGVERGLATERLDEYRQDDADSLVTLSRYLWNMALCKALYAPLQMAEVALRSRIHAHFTETFFADDWYTTPDLLLPWQQNSVCGVLDDLKQKRVPLTSEKVISELHFGFWTGFFNKGHERSGIAHSLMKPVFKFAPKYERTAAFQSVRWNKIRSLRNSVFHHERIIHWNDLSEQHTTLVTSIGGINSELREMTQALDTFSECYQEGTQPWIEKVRHHWPENH